MIPFRTQFIRTAAAMTLLTMAAASHAQVSEMLIFETQPANVSSGLHHAPDGPHLTLDEQIIRTQMFATIVHEPRANMLRLHFSDFDLGEYSEIRITSLADGAVQHFSHEMLQEWGGWSAIFNGESVVVELLVAPGDAAFFEITEIAVNDPPVGDFEGEAGASLCNGTDSRVASGDSRVGRMSNTNCGSGGNCGGCTAWLASTGAAISAGHCNGANRIIEFNVPQSQSNGNPVAAHPNNQYPIGVTWYAFQDGGQGFDWAIMSVGLNSNTGLHPHWVQNHFHLAPLVPSNGTAIRITGFGVDNVPVGSQPGTCCAWNNSGQCTHFGCNSASLTLQTATGPKDDHDTNRVFYRTDTEPANSGSPIIWNSNGYAIGVHTHGGCTSGGGSNKGTRLTQAVMAEWLDNFNNNATFVNVVSPSGFLLGTALHPATTFGIGVNLAPSGGTVAIAKGNYSDTGVFDKNLTVKAVSGIVTIGN